MTTSVIRAGGTGVAGVQTTGGDDGALSLKVGPLDTTVEALSIASSGAVTFNDAGADVDFRVESDGNASMLHVDAGNNRVGVGTATPASAFHVYDTSGGDAQMYLETSTNSTGARIHLKSPNAAGANYHTIGSFNGSTATWRIGGTGTADQIDFQTGSSYTTRMSIDSGGKVGIGMTPVASYGLLQVGSAVTSALGVTGLQAYVSGTNSALGQNGNLSIVTTNGQAANLGGSIGLGGKYVAAGTSALFAHIAGRKENGTDNNSAGYLQLATQTHGGVPTEKMRIDSIGRVGIGVTGATAGWVQINFNTAYHGIILKSSVSGTNSAINFLNSADAVQGSITTNGSGATAYNTSSDYRLKENIEYNWDAMTELKKLKPAKFNFIADPSKTVEGFLAHEVENIVPAAIRGTKDAVEEDGSIKPQQIDQSKLVPLLVKTILELETRITALEG